MSVNQPTLIVTGGALDGQVVRLPHAGRALLGSGADTAAPLALGNVAPHHALLEWDGEQLHLAALETPTGTYVNGERISGSHVLADGDRLCLGPPGSKQSVKFLVRLEGVPGEPADEALPGFEAPELDGTLDLTEPAAAEPPALLLISPEAGAAPPAAAASLPGWSEPLAPAAPAEPEPAGGTSLAESPAEAAVAAPPPAVPKTEARRRPEYTDEMPSMVPEGSEAREPPAVRPSPAAPVAAPRAQSVPARRGPATLRLGRLEVPRVAALAALGILAAAGTWLALGVFVRPAPVLQSVVPPRVAPGATVTLVGQNFAVGGENNEVRIGDQRATVSFASEDRVTIQLPDSAPAGGAADLPVRVISRGRASNALHLKVFVPPSIKSIEPGVALPGAEVVLAIPGATAGLKVEVGGQPAAVLEIKAGAVRVRVPDLPVVMGRKVKVIAESNGLPGSAAELVLGKLPMLLSVAPASGAPGTPLRIEGRGFAPEPAANVVTVGGVPALVLAATPLELRVVTPLAGGGGSVSAPIEVRVADAPSNPLPFVVDRPSTTVFVLRCFAAPVPGAAGRAFVATEYGPLLLLSDKAAVASVGERAVRVSEALNQMAEAALAGRPPVFELREAPRPAVGVAGGDVLVAPEAGDVPAYGPKASARAVAGHWTNLLADTFALFVEFRRPTRLAETSSAGKLLIDLFAEAQRRAAQTGSAPGVPRAQLFPMAASLERQLKDLALKLPGAPEKGAAAVVVEGLWDGSMSEAGSEPRSIQVTLRRAGGRLAGSLSTSARTLSMGIPLGDVSYEKGQLRFTLQVGGVPRTFTGALQGSTVSGTITSPASKEPVGTFRLTFVK